MKRKLCALLMALLLLLSLAACGGSSVGEAPPQDAQPDAAPEQPDGAPDEVLPDEVAGLPMDADFGATEDPVSYCFASP